MAPDVIAEQALLTISRWQREQLTKIRRKNVMKVYIKAYGPVSDPGLIEGQFVEFYDPEAFNGGGDAKFTLDQSKALAFDSLQDAKDFCLRTPTCRPFRADGLPNRPLTTFSLEFISG